MKGLCLLRMQPDMGRLSRWVRRSGQRAYAEDLGYALHAATKAALGDMAPKPFALRQREGATELIGYCHADAQAVQRAAMLNAHDPEAAAAIGLDTLVAKAMPDDWQAGERYSFEVRVAPVVRSRTQQAGSYVEVDAAFHATYATPERSRDHAYQAWLHNELARAGGAELVACRTQAFAMAPMARRAAAATLSGAGSRHLHRGLLPDLTVRGELRVADRSAFNACLARGLGRHRAFGFGCLLLAPPGAFVAAG